MKAIAEIIGQLVRNVTEGTSVNLNEVKQKVEVATSFVDGILDWHLILILSYHIITDVGYLCL